MHFFHVPISRLYLPLAVLGSFISLFFLRKKEKTQTFISFLIFILLFLLFILLTGLIYSNGWDENAYHKIAVGFLKNGWNPFYESSDDFRTFYFHNSEVSSGSPWTDCYGKATWYIAASIYKWTNNIECGKSYNLIGFLLVFLFSFYFFDTHFKGKFIKNISISWFIAMNPVVITQLFSYYVDGFMGAMLFILLLGLIMMLDENFDPRDTWVIIFPSMCILGNIKFTGLAYGGIFCIIFYIYSIIRKHRDIKFIKQNLVNFMATALFAIFITGSPTYVTNFFKYSNPLYPILGKNKIDIITQNSPMGFQNKSVFFKLFYSLFGITKDHSYDNTPYPLPKLKVPFTTSLSEMKSCFGLDIRIAGFGVFFSGLLIISAIIVIVYFIKKIKSKTWAQSDTFLFAFLVSILLLLIIIQDSWWARYSPYAYLLVIFPIVICFYFAPAKKGNFITIFLLVLLFNNALWLHTSAFYLKNSSRINQELNSLTNQSIEVINEINFPGILFNLEDHNIKYKVVFDESVSGESTIFYGMLSYTKK